MLFYFNAQDEKYPFWMPRPDPIELGTYNLDPNYNTYSTASTYNNYYNNPNYNKLPYFRFVSRMNFTFIYFILNYIMS